MQTHAAGVDKHPHCLGRTASATRVLQFGNCLSEAVGGGFLDGCPINARLDQPALGLGRPLITPVLEQPLQPDALHKIRPGCYRSKRHFEKRETVKEPAALTVRSLAIKIERAFATYRILDVQPELLSSDAKIFNERWHARLGRHFTDACPAQSVTSQAENDFPLGVHRTPDETTPNAVKQVLAGWTRVTAECGQTPGLLQGGDFVSGGQGHGQLLPARELAQVNQDSRSDGSERHD